MQKSFLPAAAALAVSAFVSFTATPASAGPFCATYPEGQGYRSCNYYSYSQCTRTTAGAGGQCKSNPYFGGYADSYAYAPAPYYRSRYGYGYEPSPGYYARQRAGIYID